MTMERHHARQVAPWLLACCAMVFAMVVLGGVTRLTGSGLSMVNWRPVTGTLPPLDAAAWDSAFAAYKASPEFRKINFWMTLADFKTIYWMEYAHRLWGRLIGVVFLLPMLWFVVRRRITRRLAARLGLVFVLGGAQGALGWYMVKSGLVDRPDVSQYRLAAHLVLAVAIYGYMLWLALGLLGASARHAASGVARAATWLTLGWTVITVITGALVAGIDAGLSYNTFPLMDGRLVPPGMPGLGSGEFFDNAAAVQFTHRAVAIALVVIVLALWGWLRAAAERSRALAWAAAMACVQAGLGIATLLSEVAIPLAAAHQAGAMVLLSLMVWAVRGLGKAPAARTTA